jgi:hypothetical protein
MIEPGQLVGAGRPRGASSTTTRRSGPLNGTVGRFEWIVDNGNVTHRMFVASGGVNGIPIKP